MTHVIVRFVYGQLVQDIKENFSYIEKLVIFSDNCAAQFKSKYSMSALCKIEADFKVAIEWNVFASSHGKGAVDGIGGTVKRHAWMAVKENRNGISQRFSQSHC